jgi:hypothetical protein
MAYQVRRWLTIADEIHHDTGPAVAEPTRRAAVAVVIKNPYASRWSQALDELIEPSGTMAVEMIRRARASLGAPAEGCGKAAIVGSAGEQEHGVACLTSPFGDALRDGVGGTTWVTSNTKVGGPGSSVDVPLAYKRALFVRDFYDTITVSVPDGPRPDEIVIIVALSSAGRVHARLGGLARQDATAADGLR